MLENTKFTEALCPYGTLIPIGEWIQDVKSGFFIDYDGFGYAVKDKLQTKRRFYPSEIGKIASDTTHIMWINR